MNNNCMQSLRNYNNFIIANVPDDQKELIFNLHNEYIELNNLNVGCIDDLYIHLCKIKGMDSNVKYATWRESGDIHPNIKEEFQISAFDMVLKYVANYFGIEQHTLSFKKRDIELVFPRKILIFICHSLGITYQFIGSKLNGFDHATMLYHYKKTLTQITPIHDGIIPNRILRNSIQEICDLLKLDLNLILNR